LKGYAVTTTFIPANAVLAIVWNKNIKTTAANLAVCRFERVAINELAKCRHRRWLQPDG
jgi:hypothetical protein